MDLQTLQSDVAHDFTLPLLTKNNELANDDCTIHFNLCITATRVEEEEDKEEVEKQMASNKYVSSSCLREFFTVLYDTGHNQLACT